MPKVVAYAGGVAVALIVVLVVFIFFFGNAIVNGCVRNKVEKAFAKAHPGFAMRIGRLSYLVGADATVAESITVSATNAVFKADRLRLMGVRWSSLFRGKPVLANIFAKASLEATNLEAEFLETRYRALCGRLQANVAGGELAAGRIELGALKDDKDFFSAREFRDTRFHVVVPECRVSGLAYDELFAGTSYRAASIHVVRPTFDALVDCDKPNHPFVKSPLMVHEALAAILKPLQIDSLQVDGGSIKYSEQVVAGGNPGVLTFTAVGLSVENIANRGRAEDAMKLQGQGNLMGAGTLKLLMTIPIMPTNFSLRYSGSLGAMNLTNLNAFLDIDAHTRITSGFVNEADFEIDVAGGQARGQVRGTYQKLEIAILDKKSGSANGIEDRITSLLANMLRIRSSNNPELPGSAKKGKVEYTRRPDEEFLQFLWFALRSGVLDIISH